MQDVSVAAIAVAVRPRIPCQRRYPSRLVSCGALEPYVRVVRRVHSARIVDGGSPRPDACGRPRREELTLLT